ncbi:MAG: coenzyme F420-0:L-glutamate ligase [Chloroflexi bacterium]|nr:coenzyme F420-0:L-glutamate ligase [Chloroflexota bacterium]
MDIPRLEIIGITGLPEIRPGDRLGKMFVEAAQAQGTPLDDHDVLVVAQKAVSKAEGRFVDLRTVKPKAHALQLAERSGKDARLIQLVLLETRHILKLDPDRGLIIGETRHGFVCANAGIDASNVPGEDTVLLLPEDPDASAARIREEAMAEEDVRALGVVVSDTFGRAFREGHTDVALGVAGFRAIVDYRGMRDAVGKELRVTQMAMADEIAGAAEMVAGKANGIPAVIVRGLKLAEAKTDAKELLRDRKNDLFR